MKNEVLPFYFFIILFLIIIIIGHKLLLTNFIYVDNMYFVSLILFTLLFILIISYFFFNDYFINDEITYTFKNNSQEAIPLQITHAKKHKILFDTIVHSNEEIIYLKTNSPIDITFGKIHEKNFNHFKPTIFKITDNSSLIHKHTDLALNSDFLNITFINQTNMSATFLVCYNSNVLNVNVSEMATITNNIIPITQKFNAIFQINNLNTYYAIDENLKKLTVSYDGEKLIFDPEIQKI